VVAAVSPSPDVFSRTFQICLIWLIAAGCSGPTLVAQPDARPSDDAIDTGQIEAAAGSSGQGDAGGAAGDDGAAPDATPSSSGAWTDLTPPAPLPAAWPSARSTHAMAYDSARDRIVVFAGSHTLRDVWEWNPGTKTWTERTPATTTEAWPPPLYGHAMVYDAGRKKMFVFGGGTTVGVRNDSWEWDGTAGTWEKRSTTTSPPALSSHAMAYDAARSKVVLFGGYNNSFNGVARELWEWDGASSTWTNRTPGAIPGPEAWPAARDGTSLVFDVGRRKSVLFGGFDNAGKFFSDLWEWDGDGGTWMNRTPAAPAPSWPDARESHAAVYDAHRDRSVIFGGGPTRRDVWEWNAADGTWSERLPSSPLADWPTGRAAHAMAYDSLRRNVILFGGCCTLQDLWSWNGGE
jgi:hypothetical protein